MSRKWDTLFLFSAEALSVLLAARRLRASYIPNPGPYSISKLLEYLRIRSPTPYQHMKRMVCTLDAGECGAWSEFFGDAFDERPLGELVPRSLQEQHRHLDILQMLCTGHGRLLGQMQGKPHKTSPRTPGSGSAAWACEVILAPKDFPPANSGSSG